MCTHCTHTVLLPYHLPHLILSLDSVTAILKTDFSLHSKCQWVFLIIVNDAIISF